MILIYLNQIIELSVINQIVSLKPTKSISTYITDFMSLTSILGLDEKAKLISFQSGLYSSFQYFFTIIKESQTFATYMIRAIEIDQKIFLATKKECKTLTKPSTTTQIVVKILTPTSVSHPVQLRLSTSTFVKHHRQLQSTLTSKEYQQHT